MSDGVSSMETIRAVYLVTSSRLEIEKKSRAIALEQTVEVPLELVPREILAEVVARVASIRETDEAGRFQVTLDYAVDLSAYQLSQLLNLVYGNVSIQPGVRLVDLILPDSFLSRFRGPRYGVEGTRDLLGIERRPLLVTALKPRGSKIPDLARLAGEFARGGGDIVKDDHNLVEDSEEEFRSRVLACRDAVAGANAKTGLRTLYLPCLCPRTELLEKRLEFLVGEGFRGVLVSPFLLGLDLTRSLFENPKRDLLVMAHPALTGPLTNPPDTGIDHGVLLGTLFRLAGADLSIFPNHGGRFSYSKAQCLVIVDKLRSKLGTLKPSMPAPAGGMSRDRLPEVARDYGPDAAYLIGGALLGHSKDLAASTGSFLEEIRRLPTSAPTSASTSASTSE